MRAAVLGAGSFGTALGFLLGGKGEVRLWTRDADAAREIDDEHTNARYLPGTRLPDRVRATCDLSEALAGAELVVVATPSHTFREVLGAAAPHLPQGVPLVSAAKGIEEGTLLTPTEVMESVLPEHFHPWLAVLSGPSFAREIVRGAPTAVTAAASWSRVARRVQEAFSGSTFRCYTSSDVVGVQLGAALKNVMAIGAGIVDGLGFGHNARAALITRGLAEMTRLAVHRGGNPVTLYGLAGLGDLVLTCTGDLSRNRTVGLELGRGKKLPEILAALGQVAEGVKTARSAHDMAAAQKVDAPITSQVHAILHEGKDPRQAVTELMTRDLKAEF
jgi:glycerol-3-phosphate dehydrogenase (NAD(P)+)